MFDRSAHGSDGARSPGIPPHHHSMTPGALPSRGPMASHMACAACAAWRCAAVQRAVCTCGFIGLHRRVAMVGCGVHPPRRRKNEISLKPARTLAELASARQHQENPAGNHGARGGGQTAQAAQLTGFCAVVVCVCVFLLCERCPARSCNRPSAVCGVWGYLWSNRESFQGNN